MICSYLKEKECTKEETWFSQQYPDNFLSFTGYNLDRLNQSKRGGCLLIFLREQYDYSDYSLRNRAVFEKNTLRLKFLAVFIKSKVKKYFLSNLSAFALLNP